MWWRSFAPRGLPNLLARALSGILSPSAMTVRPLSSTQVVVPLTVASLTLGQAIAAAGRLTNRDRELGTIRIYRSGDLYQIPLRDYLARPEFRQLVPWNGDAGFADTSYDLDRALAFYRDQIDVISLNRQARGRLGRT
ncbi:hypothetical protein [Ruegeria arenilitoris]|uniref:hypothetical protein n=1 Tax=Ruegeria arenilitoris TaxID=1173585 RepID=UPI001480A8BB|nr:hypothetical protein [Ruegeria arenilitoris]